ncbi:eCIS core domain-containing protein [Ensifer canadensis]
MSNHALHKGSRAQSTSDGRALQRKCSCEAHGETCERCAEKRKLQRKSAWGRSVSEAPPIVDEVLRSSGDPLDDRTRASMEARFGHDFSGVRVHTGDMAARSATMLDAHAYTTGDNIVFASGRYAPETNDGKRLLGHELTHVIQQARNSSSSEPDAEREADRAGTSVAAGHRAVTTLGAASGIQRSGLFDWVPSTSKIANNLAANLPGNNVSSRLVAAAATGLIEELVHQVRKEGLLTKLMGNLAKFEAKNAPSLAVGYSVGVAEGLVSPITDLFGIITFAEQIRNLGIKLAISGWNKASALASDLGALAKEFGNATSELAKFLGSLKSDPIGSIVKLLSLPGAIAEGAEGLARDLGRKGGREIANEILSPWSTEKKPEEKAPDWVSSPAGALGHAAGKVEDKIIDDPWSKLGKKIGYAIGFVTIQALLIAFSGSIGNVIAEAAAGLGRFGEWLGSLGKGVISIAERLASAGKVIAEVEAAFDALMARLLKPLGAFLDPLMKPIAGVMEKLKVFLRRVLGLAEKEAAPIAGAAVKKGVSEAGGALAEGGLKAAPTPPHAPAHVPPHAPSHTSPQAAPHPAADAPAPTPKVVHEGLPAEKPPAHGGAATQEGAPAKAGGTTIEPKPIEVGVDGGHHIRVSERGIELCSECILLDVVYADEMKRFPGFRDDFNKLKALRKTNPEQAASKAAILQKELENLRANPPKFTNVPARPTPEGLTAVPKEGPKPPAKYSDVLDQPGIHEAHSPGGAPPKQATIAGTVSHEYFEDLPTLLQRNAEQLLPHGTIPNGFTKEFPIPHPQYPPGRGPRIDRINFDTGEIIEIGPSTAAQQKFVEAQQYAEWMDRFMPRSNGEKWIPSVRTYEKEAVRQYLRDIGYFEQKAASLPAGGAEAAIDDAMNATVRSVQGELPGTPKMPAQPAPDRPNSLSNQGPTPPKVPDPPTPAPKTSNRVPSHGELQEPILQKKYYPDADIMSEKAGGFDFASGHKKVSAHTGLEGDLNVVTERISGGNWTQLKVVNGTEEQHVISNIDYAMKRADNGLKGIPKNELQPTGARSRVYEPLNDDPRIPRKNQFERMEGGYGYRTSYASRPDQITIHLHFENVPSTDAATLDRLRLTAQTAVLNNPYVTDLPPVRVLVTGR